MGEHTGGPQFQPIALDPMGARGLVAIASEEAGEGEQADASHGDDDEHDVQGGEFVHWGLLGLGYMCKIAHSEGGARG